jgi:hypothetical protein
VAGETGAHSAKLGLGALERAAAYVKALPVPAEGAALAAHATPEGPWKFVNREGEVFTAGTPAELQRAVPALLPQAPRGSKLAIYLSEDTVFGDRALLDALPANAALHVVARNDSYPLVRAGIGKAPLFAAVRPNLRVELIDRELFSEALAQLERPMSRASIRTLALEPGGPTRLASVPRFDAQTKEALVDAIDPVSLAGALRSVRGQTVLLTGRAEGNRLLFRPASGPEQSLKISDAIAAAVDADVNLVILHAPAPRQPGGRNWLWQRIAVDGLDDALTRATLADFLDALGASRGTFRVGVAREGRGRVVIRATPDGPMAEPIGGIVGDWLTTATTSITGNVVTSAIEVHARDDERQQELDRRLIPYVPANVQFAYILALVAGVLGWPVARAWWDRLWPAEERGEYGGAAGYRAAQAARSAVFLLVFLPIAGLPALLWLTLLQFWSLVTAPVRFVRWLTSGTAAGAG